MSVVVGMGCAFAVLALLAVAGCASPGSGRYDPRLYDANGRVVTAGAPSPPLPPAPTAPECGQVQRLVIIAGQPLTAVATACRDPNGSWHFKE